MIRLPAGGDAQTRLSNFGLGLVWNTFFRIGYSPATMRRGFDLVAGVSADRLMSRYPGVRCEPWSADGVPAETITAGDKADGTIFYLHGGGYFMGSIAGYRRHALRLAYRCRKRVVLVDYRLAPEHPHPAALDDARKAYHAVRERFDAGPDTVPLFLGGDSAGGGLALALLLALRDAGEPLPRAAFFLSPWTDLTGDARSVDENAKRDVWLSRRHTEVWGEWYRPGADRKHPYVSPRFGDFKGLPPLLFFVGDQEVLLDDSRTVVELAQRAGVDARLEIGPMMQHVWMIALPFLKDSKTAYRAIADYLSRL